MQYTVEEGRQDQSWTNSSFIHKDETHEWKATSKFLISSATERPVTLELENPVPF